MRQATPSVKELFFAALELESSADRSAFLDRHCSDAELRGRIEELLAADARESDFLEAPAAMPDPTSMHESRQRGQEPGAAIGPYRLMEVVGEGGMGIVYVAEQLEPVRRRVALKVIKPGMDSRQVVARFEAERQALAMMDHTNIARVFDGGMTTSGRPYFVMELVRGLPITEYCDEQQLSIVERLELFVLVCRAVQHAHHKGVIHRDLKPSNVLVTVVDGAAVPKVIDFGVAKATGQALTDKTVYTGLHQFVGTPLYMSPEQAGLSGVDVDTRSDVYALGVLLYELLTGTTPFDSETLKRAAFDEMRRIIREEEPPRPSTRLSGLGERLSDVSSRRKADPKRLGPSIEGELDWVVMKALEKDRGRRYETANDFAADVMRHLGDLPVEAHPPSAWYRVAKFARRNRTALVAGGLAALALLVGTVVSAWQAVRATQAQRETAQAFATARRAVDEMYSQFAEDWIAKQPKLTKVQGDFLDKALAFYEQFAGQRSEDPQAAFDAAIAWRRVGNIRRKLGRVEEAEAAYRKEVEQLDRLAARFPERMEYALEGAVGWIDLGAVITDRGGRYTEAETIFKHAAAVLDALAARSPESREVRVRLAYSLYDLGAVLNRQGRNADAEPTLSRSRTLFERLLEDGPLQPEFRRLPPLCESELGKVYIETGRLAEAEGSYRGAVTHLESLLDEDPLDAGYRRILAVALANLSTISCRTDRLAEALECDRRAVDLLEALAREFPDEPESSNLLEVCLVNLNMTLHGLGEDAEHQRVARRGVDLSERLMREEPSVAQHRQHLASLLCHLADLCSVDPGGPFYDPGEAVKLARRAVEVDPGGESVSRQSLGWALYRIGDWKGCLEAIQKQRDHVDNGSFVAAMAYRRLGDEAKAREVFAQAETNLTDYERRWNLSVYPRPATLRRLRDEAAAMLDATSSGEDGRPRRPTGEAGPSS